MTRKPAFFDSDNQMPLRPGVAEAVTESLALEANAMSRSLRGLRAKERLERAREALAGILGANPAEVVFTSSASEANTWALERVVMRKGAPPRGMRVSPLEHVSVLNAARTRGVAEGIPVGLIGLHPDGTVDLDRFERDLPEPPFLVSVQWANPEVGLVQPIDQIGRIVRERGGVLHVDFVAAESSVRIRLDEHPIDLLTVSSGRLGGPPGIAALVVRRGIRIAPLIEGGAQEDGRRGGTVPVFLAEGWEAALRHWDRFQAEETSRLHTLTGHVENWVTERLEDVEIAVRNGPRIPGILNLLVRGIDGQAALSRLDSEGIEVGTGSSCSSDSLKVSHVLTALGITPVFGQGSVVLTMGWDTHRGDVDRFCDRFPEVLDDLRRLAPTGRGKGFAG
jgi:cysteine desulfurase